MNFEHLSDTNLHDETIKLIATEREGVADFLLLLGEIDRRQLYFSFHYRSLYQYCVEHLRLGAASAQRRISSARLLMEIPEIEDEIRNGEFTLTNLAKAVQFFHEYDIEDTEEKKSILSQISGLSTKACEKKLFGIFKKEIFRMNEAEDLGDGRYKITVTLSDETLAEVEKLKDLLGMNLSMDELLLYMAKAGITKLEKKTGALPLAKVGSPYFNGKLEFPEGLPFPTAGPVPSPLTG